MPIRILAVVPVELHPLVPEGEGVHLEPVRLDLLDEVCGPAFIIPPVSGIGTPRCHEVTLYIYYYKSMYVYVYIIYLYMFISIYL